MDFTDQAVILRTGAFREHDMWVRFITPSHGLLTAFAFGGRISRRRFCGCLEPLSHVRLSVQQSRRGYLQLSEGTLVEKHTRLKRDASRLGLAAHCLKFVEAVPLDAEGSGAVYELLAQGMARLDDPRPLPPHWAMFFRARLTFLQGYAPEAAALAACHACAKPLEQMTAPRFSIERGGLACRSCPTEDPQSWTGNRDISRRLPAGPDTVAALHEILAHGPQEWDAAPLPPQARRECFDLIEAFVEYHLGLRMSGAGFVRA